MTENVSGSRDYSHVRIGPGPVQRNPAKYLEQQHDHMRGEVISNFLERSLCFETYLHYKYFFTLNETLLIVLNCCMHECSW